MRASPESIRICVPNLVAVRRSCRKKGVGYRQTDKGTLHLYIVDALGIISLVMESCFQDTKTVVKSCFGSCIIAQNEGRQEVTHFAAVLNSTKHTCAAIIIITLCRH